MRVKCVARAVFVGAGVLQVEQGTPFARWYSGQDSPLPQEPEAVHMFEAAAATLTAAGYEHYEVRAGLPSGLVCAARGFGPAQQLLLGS